MYIIADSTAKAYESIVYELLEKPEYISTPRGLKCHETISARIEITNPYSNSFKNGARDLPLKYLCNELLLYFSRSNKEEDFAKASKFWSKISTEGYINSSYGFLIFTRENHILKRWFNLERKTGDHSLDFTNKSQWDWAKDSLLNDKDSRQAVMFLARPYYQYESVKDFVCTFNYQFLIRNNKLIMIVNRRSQDIFKGFPYDAAWEMLLMQCMRIELLNKYHDLTLGSIIFNINSIHLYEDNINILRDSITKFSYKEHKLPEINEMPIENDTIDSMASGAIYIGDDEFFKFLNKYSQKENKK